VTPAGDTWRRARRERVRDVVVVPIAIVVVLVLMGLSMAHVTATSRGGFEPIENDSPAPALPDRLYAVPNWAEPTEDGFDVGQLSIVWAQRGLPGVVGVSATTGEYVVLELPDFAWGQRIPMASRSQLALSPDGEKLAYAWFDVSVDDPSARASGIDVVDLRSGSVKRKAFDLPASNKPDRIGVYWPKQLQWTPDGQKLSFRFVHVNLEQQGERLVGDSVGPSDWSTMNVRSGVVTRWRTSGLWYKEPATPDPHGTSMLVASNGGVWRAQPDGTRTKIATWGSSFDRPRDILWTEQGIAMTDAERLRLIRLDGGPDIGLPGVTVFGRRDLLAASSQQVASIGPLDRSVLEVSALSPDSGASSRHIYLFGDDDPPQLQAISVAASALDAEPRQSSAPDWGPSPAGVKILWLIGGVGVLLVGAVSGLVWWPRLRLRR
jgi:hypothetical protein